MRLILKAICVLDRFLLLILHLIPSQTSCLLSERQSLHLGHWVYLMLQPNTLHLLLNHLRYCHLPRLPEATKCIPTTVTFNWNDSSNCRMLSSCSLGKRLLLIQSVGQVTGAPNLRHQVNDNTFNPHLLTICTVLRAGVSVLKKLTI